jgi:hypothetical protein
VQGKVLAQGNYSSLVDQGVDFVSLLASENDDPAGRKISVINPAPEKPKVTLEVLEYLSPLGM